MCVPNQASTPVSPTPSSFACGFFWLWDQIGIAARLCNTGCSGWWGWAACRLVACAPKAGGGQSDECQPRVPKHVAAREQDHPLVLLTRRDASNQPQVSPRCRSWGRSLFQRCHQRCHQGRSPRGRSPEPPLEERTHLLQQDWFAGSLACIMKPIEVAFSGNVFWVSSTPVESLNCSNSTSFNISP